MDISKIVKDLGARQVSENLFEVPFAIISDMTFSTDETGNFDFSNPRTMFEGFDSLPNGMDEENMEFLRTSISQKGLLTPLIARYTDNKLTLINGHRRYLAIKSLIENNVSCFDNHLGVHKLAKEIYANVLVKVFSEANEIEAYILAFEEDKTKVKFGQGVEYKFVDYCLQKNISDEQIIQMTGNSQTWLDGVKNLFSRLNGDCPIDNEILDAVYSGKMSIGAAKLLAEIDDFEERTNGFKLATVEAFKEAEAKKDKLDKQLKNNKKKQDTAKAKGTICESFGDTTGKKNADDILEEFLQEEKEIKSKQQNISPVITAGTLGSIRGNGNTGPRSGKQSKKKESKKETAEEEKQDNKISKEFLVKSWLDFISRFDDGKIDDIEADEFVVDIARDLITSLLNDQSCKEFLTYWSEEARMKFKLAE